MLSKDWEPGAVVSFLGTVRVSIHLTTGNCVPSRESVRATEVLEAQ